MPDDIKPDDIKKVAVIGAGVMGAGVAAHFANAGIPVLLLDVVPAGAENRNITAQTALDKLLKADPAPFMHKSCADLVTPGNIEDDLPKLADVDWIVEAVVERLDVKQALYHKLAAHRRPGTAISTNTSTIPLAKLVDGMPESLRRDFLVTHFFNPPRYMRLLELVAGPETDPATVAAVVRCADHRLGKTVVRCKDSPGFIANRIGALWIESAFNHAVDLGLTVEEADAVAGRPMGVPKTGIFGLLDLVGLDLMPHVARSLLAELPADDPYHQLHRDHPVVARLIADGYTGRKGKGGFYRLNTDSGERVKEAVDLNTGAFRPALKAELECLAEAKTLPALIDHPDRGGRFARAVLADVLSYAAALVPAISDSVADVDAAMRLGYAWTYGPFELIDRLGPGRLAEVLRAAGRSVPPLLEQLGARPFYRVEQGRLQAFAPDGDYRDVERAEGALLLADVKRRGAPLAKNGSAALWDVGDGVACLEFHGKMNALDPDVMAMIRKALEIVPHGFKALVIYNEGVNFSVGANIGLALFAANIAAWAEIEAMVAEGQATYQALRYAPFPVVGAPCGLALGGGCEILLHCDAVQAHAETYIGLVEVGVGVIPAWGGCAEMLRRWAEDPQAPRGPMPAVMKAFEMISTAAVAKSAFEAKDRLLLRRSDGVTMNRDRLLSDAKALALRLAEDYRPPAPPSFRLPGPAGKAALDMAVNGFAAVGKATPHDVTVCGRLAETLTGGDADPLDEVTVEVLLAAERRGFMALARTPATLARIETMLTTGKPLRN
jgi:3-hydroxyacyl-CoA dehydrogenase